MRLMFAVFVVSLFALLWAALAIARHIRRQEKARSTPLEATPDVSGQEIEAAGRR